MIKNVLKYLGLGLAVVILVLLAAEGVLYAKYRFSDEYKTKKELEKLVEEYKNDPYGGDTPEETLRLFISALKEGDVELASKYFVFDEQEKWKNDLEIGKNNGNLDKLIQIVSQVTNGKELFQDAYQFYSVENSEIKYTIDLIYNNDARRWKIEEL